jgi:hypothetical protein
VFAEFSEMSGISNASFFNESSIRRLRFLAMLSVGCLILAQAGYRGYAGYCQQKERANLVRLNRMVEQYAQTRGSKPDPNLIELYECGMTERRLHPTPYGGFYRFDPKAGIVYNPNRFRTR